VKLDSIIEPHSIAVYGLSKSNPFHPANVIYAKNHLRTNARTYAINPKGGRHFGQQVYSSITELPEVPDLAVLTIRADFVPDTLRECIAAGVKGAIIVSGGFAEAGRHDLREEVRRICEEHDFPAIGPNCLGVYAPPNVNTIFLPVERIMTPKQGCVSIVSQSGGYLVEIVLNLVQENVGISSAVSIGNKDVIDEVDVLQYFAGHDATRVVGVYVEGFKEGRGRVFAETVRSMNKPVVVFKAGKTPGGTRAVSSHTAALAGDYLTFSEVMKQCGAIEADSPGEFSSFCKALGHYRGKGGKRTVIISVSGGHGAIASDLCSAHGLDLVEIPQADKAALSEKLSENVRKIVSYNNPIDLTGSVSDADIAVATNFFLERDYVDQVILLCLPYVPGATPDIGAHVSLFTREFDKPVLVYIPNMPKYQMYIEGFESNGIPVSHSVEGVVYMAKALARYYR